MAATVLTACGNTSTTQVSSNFGEEVLRITAPDGEVREVDVYVADTGRERGRGLMGVEDLEGRAGMLFVFETETITGFYMLDTPMPLSIAWVGADGRVVDTADMEPCPAEPCQTYLSDTAYQLAVEVPQGDLDDLGLVEGGQMERLG